MAQSPGVFGQVQSRQLCSLETSKQASGKLVTCFTGHKLWLSTCFSLSCFRDSRALGVMPLAAAGVAPSDSC